MRPFLVCLIPLLIILFGLNSATKTAYATHAGNFANQCYLESLDGNCENAAVPTGCRLGDPLYANTGTGCCLDYQDFYQANGHPTVTATCQNTCSYDFAIPNIDPRSGAVCPIKIDGSGISHGGVQTFCCIFTTPPTPTPIPPTPTPIPPTPTPTLPPPTPTPIPCTLSDTDGLGWNETCKDSTGTYKDTCSGNTPFFEFCISNLCTQTPQATCPVGTTCIVQANGQPTCVAGPPPTPTPIPVPCQVTTSPAVHNLSVGGTGIVTASVTGLPLGKTISQMLFGSYNTAIATVSPTSDPNSPYSTTVTGVAVGATAVWATAQLSDGDTTTCQSTGATDTDVFVSGTTPTPIPPTQTPIPPTPTPTGCGLYDTPLTVEGCQNNVYMCNNCGQCIVTGSLNNCSGACTLNGGSVKCFPISVAGIAFEDTNSNGVQDAGEKNTTTFSDPCVLWAVDSETGNLFCALQTVLGPISTFTLKDATSQVIVGTDTNEGNELVDYLPFRQEAGYRFSNFQHSTYKVKITPPLGYTATGATIKNYQLYDCGGSCLQTITLFSSSTVLGDSALVNLPAAFQYSAAGYSTETFVHFGIKPAPPTPTPTPTPAFPDFQFQNFHLTDQFGNAKTTFLPLEHIYPWVTVVNTGGGSGVIQFVSIYSNQASQPACFTSSDKSVWVYDPASLPAGATKTYSVTQNPGNYTNQTQAGNFWTMPTTGSFSSGAYVDSFCSQGETNEFNNFVASNYTISTLPPCEVTTSPPVYNLGIGGTGTVTASVTSGQGVATISQMRFGSYNTTIATVSPTSDPSSPYSTTVTAVAGGATAVWGTADLSDGRICQSTGITDTDVNVSGPTPTPTPTTPPPPTPTPAPTIAPTPTPTPTPIPTYSISGTIFTDTNANSKKDFSEPNYTGPISIAITTAFAGFSVSNIGGSYSSNNLPSGQYTVTFSGLPAGSTFTYPLSSLIVQVGSPCSVPITSEASCFSGTISNLNAGVRDTFPWFQSKGSDMRWDSGFTNILPSDKFASILGAGGMPGIIFSGSSSPNFGQGSASQSPFNWIVGSFAYPEVFTDTHNLIPTSYRFLLETVDSSSITKKGVTDLCSGGSDPTNCALTPTLENGVYKIDGDLSLNGSGYTFPANKNFVILVNGNLNINEKILVPIGSAAIFSASGNITVNRAIGEPASSAAPTIEGLYSADGTFTADGIKNCSLAIDLRLNVAGSVVANAGRGGGTFVNNRDMCTDNSSFPSVSFIERPDFLLNYPDLAKQTTRVWQEVAP